jgi:hypothetical protein
MTEVYYLRSRVEDRGPTIYFAHPFTSVEEALQEAKRKTAASDFDVWIVDNEGNLVLPTDQVHSRLSHLHS